MALNAKLVVVGGDIKATEVKLKLPATIGRGRGTTIMLPHPLVSRQHCELFERDGYLVVRDMGSLNGTYVGQEKISESPVPPEALLTIGTVTFRAVYEATGEIPATAMPLPAGGTPAVVSFDSDSASNDSLELEETTTAPQPAKAVAKKSPAPKQPVPKTPTVVTPPPAVPVEADAPIEAGEVNEVEDDFQSFLKSLGNK